MIALLALLLPFVPTNNLPGVPIGYLPTKGAEAALALYDKMFYCSVYLTLPVLAICVGCVLTKVATIPQMITRFILCLILLAGLPFLFGSIFYLGDALGSQIISRDDRKGLEEEFRKIAEIKTDDKGKVDLGAISQWYQVLATITAIYNPGGEESLLEIIMALITIFYYISTSLVALEWRAFAVLLYVTGPIAVVLGIIPGAGGRILSNWFGGVVQIGIGWQIWMAMTAWFVKFGQLLFSQEYDIRYAADFSQQLEAVGIAALFTIFNLATPIFVGLIFPLSSFSNGASTAFLATTFVATNVVNKVINTVTTPVKFLTGRLMSNS